MPAAVYAGSFDPLTLGHLDVIERAARMFDKLFVAVGVNSKKTPAFSVKERIAMIRVGTEFIPGKIKVSSFEGLLVQFCEINDINIIIRGLRAVGDFESELAIAQINARAGDDIGQSVDTVFLPTEPELSFISSSSVKELASHEAPLTALERYVPTNVAKLLMARYNYG